MNIFKISVKIYFEKDFSFNKCLFRYKKIMMKKEKNQSSNKGILASKKILLIILLNLYQIINYLNNHNLFK